MNLGKMPSKSEARKSAREEQRRSSNELTELNSSYEKHSWSHSTDRMTSREGTAKAKCSRQKIKSRHAPIKHGERKTGEV